MKWDKLEKLVIGLLMIGLLFLGWKQSQPETQVLDQTGEESLDPVLGFEDTSTPSEGEELSQEESSEERLPIFVHIDGAVKKPGLYELKAGDRIQDVIDLAGGLTEEASLEPINLSAKLQDEMKIHIPKQSELVEKEKSLSEENSIEDSQDRQAAFVQTPQDQSDQEDAQTKLIDINSASLEDLMSLPSIGQVKAQAIIEYREKTPFQTKEDLMLVSGIGEKTFEQLSDLIEVGPPPK